MRLPIQNGQRAKNGSESHFFLHIQIDCSGVSSAHMSNVFLQCQPFRLFQCSTSEYSWITYVFTACLTYCTNCSTETRKKRGNRPILKLNGTEELHCLRISNSFERFQSVYIYVICRLGSPYSPYMQASGSIFKTSVTVFHYTDRP